MAPEPIAEGGLIPSALRAVREGTSANAWLKALAGAGSGVRRAVGLRLYGQARRLAAEYAQEPTRPLDQAPTFSEMGQWPTRASSGVLQHVQLFYRENVTGRIVVRHYSVKTSEGITRQEAIDRAIEANEVNAERYEQQLVSAIHTGGSILVAEAAA